MIEIPVVETERLVLRPFRDDDIDAYAALHADPETMRYIDEGTPIDRPSAWRSMAMLLGHWQLRGYGLWAAEERSTGRMVGRCGLFNPEGWFGLEVGWLFARDTWGRGYATEAGAASLAWAFDQLDATHVISVIQAANGASRRVAEKLGGAVEQEIAAPAEEPFVVIYGYDRQLST